MCCALGCPSMSSSHPIQQTDDLFLIWMTSHIILSCFCTWALSNSIDKCFHSSHLSCAMGICDKHVWLSPFLSCGAQTCGCIVCVQLSNCHFSLDKLPRLVDEPICLKACVIQAHWDSHTTLTRPPYILQSLGDYMRSVVTESGYTIISKVWYVTGAGQFLYKEVCLMSS